MRVGRKFSQTQIFSRGIAGNFDWWFGRPESYTPEKECRLLHRQRDFKFKPRDEKIHAKEINAV